MVSCIPFFASEIMNGQEHLAMTMTYVFNFAFTSEEKLMRGARKVFNAEKSNGITYKAVIPCGA
jgi:hypothetical protein